jgi:chromosome segregation ATPase
MSRTIPMADLGPNLRLFDAAADEEWRWRSVQHQRVRVLETYIRGVMEKTAVLRAKLAEHEESVHRHELRRGKILPTIDEDFNTHLKTLQAESDALKSKHNESVASIEKKLRMAQQRRLKEVEDAREDRRARIVAKGKEIKQLQQTIDDDTRRVAEDREILAAIQPAFCDVMAPLAELHRQVMQIELVVPPTVTPDEFLQFVIDVTDAIMSVSPTF